MNEIKLTINFNSQSMTTYEHDETFTKHYLMLFKKLICL